MDRTDVMNLETGEILTFCLPPIEAVRSAFCLDKSRGYAEVQDFLPASLIVKTSDDGRLVYAGDYVAQIRQVVLK